MNAERAVFLVLDGSVQCLPFFEFLKSRGVRSICVDRNPQAPGHFVADFSIVHSVRDVDQILGALSNLNLSPTDVFTFSEFTVEVAILQSRLGLTGANPEVTRLSQDKVKCSETWTQSHESSGGDLLMATPRVPKTQIVVEDEPKLWKEIPEEIVFKSSGGAGGLQVRYSKSDFEARPLAPPYLIQEKILGSSHDGNAYLINGDFIPINIYDRHFIEGSVAQACLHSPSVLDKESTDDFFIQFEAAVFSLGIADGPVKVDAMRNADGEIVVLEVATRFHGPMGSLFLLGRSAQNPFETLTSLNLFPRKPDSQEETFENYSAVVCIYPGPSASQAIWTEFQSWFASALPRDSIVQLGAPTNSNDAPMSNHEMAGFVAISGTSPDVLRKKYHLIAEKIANDFSESFWRSGVENCIEGQHFGI